MTDPLPAAEAAGLCVTAAVFCSRAEGRLDLSLVHLEADDAERCAADVAARGYTFAGTIAVVDGVPKISVEPGYLAVLLAAGEVFAGFLGPILEVRQLQQFNLPAPQPVRDEV